MSCLRNSVLRQLYIWQLGSSEVPHIFLTSHLPSLRNSDFAEAHCQNALSAKCHISKLCVWQTPWKQVPCEIERSVVEIAIVYIYTYMNVYIYMYIFP